MDYGSDFSWDQKIVKEQFEPDTINPWSQKRDSDPPKKTNDDFINIFHKILNDVEKREGFASGTSQPQITSRSVPHPSSTPKQNSTKKTGFTIETTATNEIKTTVITLTYTKDQLYLLLGLIFILLIIMLLADCKKLKEKVNDLSNRIPNSPTVTTT